MQAASKYPRFAIPTLGELVASSRENGRWLAFAAVLIVVAAALAIKLPPIMQAAALSTAERAVFADYASAAILAAIFAAVLLAAPVEENDKGALLFLWCVKAALTLFFLPIYEAHYTGLDARMYFSIGALGTSGLPSLSFGAGTGVMTWLVYWATRFLPAYFHLLEMLWSFVGLLAIYLFYRGWRNLVPALEPRFLLWVGLFPGILFWSSILGKDPPVLLGIGLYFFAVARWSKTHELRTLTLAVLGALLASAIRPWLAIILAVPIVAFPLVGRQLRGWQKFALITAVGVASILAMYAFQSRFQIEDAADLVQSSNSISHSWAHGGSAVHAPQFHGLSGMLAFLPFGMFTALFRPLPGEVGNVFGLIAGMTNLALILLMVRAIRRTPLRALRVPGVLWSLCLIFVWAVMYAFPSSQNLGTAVRFKLQILPVLWPLLLILNQVGMPRYRTRRISTSGTIRYRFGGTGSNMA